MKLITSLTHLKNSLIASLLLLTLLTPHLNTQTDTSLPKNAGTGSSGSNSGLGSLSAKYESNGNPATIARTKGDIGGASYGVYQLTKNSGHAQKFANQYGGALKGLTAGSTAFDNAWKAEAQRNPAKFKEAQHKYMEQTHYQPAVNAFNKVTGLNASNLPMGIKNAIWSIGVQHGSGGARSLFQRAGIKKGDSPATILNKIYNERMKVDIYFRSSTPEIKASVKNRFKKELQDALKQL